MTKHLMTWFLGTLANPGLGIGQVEAYEGQFEGLDDASVFPPAAFVALTRMSTDAKYGPLYLDYGAAVYLVSTHVHGTSSDGMLDLIDAVLGALHDKPVRYEADQVPSIPPDLYFGRCFFSDGEFLGVLPGMSVYRLNFLIRR